MGHMGYSPLAPATLSTLPWLVFLMLFRPSWQIIIVLIIAVFLIGTAAFYRLRRSGDTKNSGHIVIDKALGFLISILFIEPGFVILCIAFVLIRAFEILKPPPVNYAKRWFKEGFAFMFDDVMAGLYVNVILQIATGMRF